MKLGALQNVFFISAFVASGCTGTEDATSCLPACRAGFSCAAGVCVESTALGCTPECRAGYQCQAGTCVARSETCTPACRAGYACEAGQCVLPAPAGPEVIDLGTVEASRNTLGQLVVDVPEDAISCHVSIETDAHQEGTIVYNLADPTGQTWFAFENFAGSPTRMAPNGGRAHALIPNAPALPFASGRYQLQVGTDATQMATYRAYAVVKRGALPARGRIDIDFLFVGVPGLSAANAASNSAFNRAFDVFRERYAAMGVDVGDVRYVDVTGADAERYAVIDSTEGPGNELEALYRLAERYTDNDRFHFYMVRAIDDSAGQGLVTLGISGGIPGPVPVPGRRASGVAVTTEGYERDPELLGHIMAHEAGHYLGLFHISERDGSSHDPLYDTAECRRDRDANGDGALTHDECRGAGIENVMFWSADVDVPQSFSADQALVVMRNPTIH